MISKYYKPVNKIRVCIGCGKKYKWTGTRQKYCLKCGLILKKINSIGQNTNWTFKGKICQNCNKVIKDPKPYQRIHKQCKKIWKPKKFQQIICPICNLYSKPINNRQKNCSQCSKLKTGLRPKKLRFEILKRDNFTCQYCGRKSPDVILQIDHIIPKSKNGKDNKDNLITACFDCNSGKKDVLLNN